MGTERALDLAADICREFEGFRARPYLCPAGIPTIGYGSTRHPDGRLVTLDDQPIDSETAGAYMRHELASLLRSVLAACPALIAHPERLGSVLSWTYNLGPARLRSSTMRVRINEGDWPNAAREMQRWKRGGGKVLPGLVRRRAVESAILESGVYQWTATR